MHTCVYMCTVLGSTGDEQTKALQKEHLPYIQNTPKKDHCMCIALLTRVHHLHNILYKIIVPWQYYENTLVATGICSSNVSLRP